MSSQYDTQSKEPYWRCEFCWSTFTLDGRETFCDTSIPLDDTGSKGQR